MLPEEKVTLITAAAELRKAADATAEPHYPYGDERMRLVTTIDGWREEIRDYVGGEMGEYAALMNPSVAYALAAWLESVAHREDSGSERQNANRNDALRVARTILA